MSIAALIILTIVLSVFAVALLAEGVRQLRASRRPVESPPVYFPCPTCGRPLDALNHEAITRHGKFHAEQAIADIERRAS